MILKSLFGCYIIGQLISEISRVDVDTLTRDWVLSLKIEIELTPRTPQQEYLCGGPAW